MSTSVVKVLVTGCLTLLEDIYIYVYIYIYIVHILLVPFFIIIYMIYILYASV